jgi:polyisoprenoid-binding protein YceI
MARAQGNYHLIESKDIDMKLSGTSTLHKWSMDAKTFTGKATFVFKGKELKSIPVLDFSLEVENLKSNEASLDKNAYKALKTSEFKDILYDLTSASVTRNKDGSYALKTHGKLTIAGITKDVPLDVVATVNADGSIRCSGSHQLNMSDYQVKPPTFMLGAMRTGDAITLDFVLVYKI